MAWVPATGKLTVDPINRMEGHMGAACVAQPAGGAGEAPGSVRIVRAEMHGNLFRGMENILTGKFKKKGSTRTFGRDPRDAMIFTQRNCGVCPIGHGTTANKNIGVLLGYKVHNEDTGNPLPHNAAVLRNLLLGANHLMSHILHFYHLVALDYVNPIVGKPFLCPRYDDSYYINDCRVTELVSTEVLTPACMATLSSLPGWGPLGPGAAINAYLVGQYLKALDMRRIAHEMLAIFGGKGPIVAAYTPGGVTATVDSSRIAAYQAKLNQIKAFVGEPTDFANGIAGTMMFDTVAVAHLFPEYFWIGNTWGNFVAYGWGESDTSTSPVTLTADFGNISFAPISNPDNRLSRRGYKTSAEPGADWNNMTHLNVVESIKHSQYKGYTGYAHPWSGKTNPLPNEDREAAEATRKYSWLKAPRLQPAGPGSEIVAEVGPLARMVVQGTYFAGVLNAAGYDLCPTFGAPGLALNTAGTPFAACYGNQGPDLSETPYTGDSTLDRIAARTIETRLMVDMVQHELNRLQAGQSGATDPGPRANAQGYGLSEASRGALGHWVKTDARGRIKLYQCVVPTTWNGSPRDEADRPGPAEKGLQGTNADGAPYNPSPTSQAVWVKDPTQPIEIIRTTHSYDYCIACAVHILTPDGEVHKVVVPPLP